MLLPELALQGPRSCLMAQEALGGSSGASNGPWPLGCCVSQRKVCLCLVPAQLSAVPPGSGNEPEELRACLQAELETEMQVSRQGEREAVPVSLCRFDLSKCGACPDALALKDCGMGQPASLKVAPHSSWECLLPGTAALGLSPVQLRLLLGRTPCLASHVGSWCVQELP